MAVCCAFTNPTAATAGGLESVGRRSGRVIGIRRTAAIVYAATAAGVVAFQVALAAGMPWGEYAMGGAFPGQFPPRCDSQRSCRRP